MVHLLVILLFLVLLLLVLLLVVLLFLIVFLLLVVLLVIVFSKSNGSTSPTKLFASFRKTYKFCCCEMEAIL